MRKRRIHNPRALVDLIWLQSQLRVCRNVITPDVAPRVAIKLRALLKSVDGAIRNAERFAIREKLGVTPT